MSSGGLLVPSSPTVVVEASAADGRRWWRHPTVVLIALLAALNLADLLTTRLVLERGGAEGNPVMRPFVDGVWAAAAVKVICLALIAALASRCLGSVKARRGLMLVVAWYTIVVAWNLTIVVQA
jgi:hypothetical protein